MHQTHSVPRLRPSLWHIFAASRREKGLAANHGRCRQHQHLRMELQLPGLLSHKYTNDTYFQWQHSISSIKGFRVTTGIAALLSLTVHCLGMQKGSSSRLFTRPGITMSARAWPALLPSYHDANISILPVMVR